MTTRNLSALLWLGAAPAIALAGNYAESGQGDISNNRLAPTAIALDAPQNHISGTISNSDLDYFTVNVPAGSSLSAILLENYTSSNPRAFIGVQAGSTFTVAPVDAAAELLLGYTHFGLDNLIGDDLLAAMDASLGTIGFTAPLLAGNYTFWINQTESALTQYGFNFVVVPEPVLAGVLATPLLFTNFFRRSRRDLRRCV